jgi:hypothetical protein
MKPVKCKYEPVQKKRTAVTELTGYAGKNLKAAVKPHNFKLNISSNYCQGLNKRAEKHQQHQPMNHFLHR